MTSFAPDARSAPVAATAVATPHLPSWLKRPIAYSGHQKAVHSCIADSRLHTVCAEARCPNRSECFARGTATFLILGDICTRNCAFCSVTHGKVAPADPDEPRRLALAAQKMALRHVVITSVTRDDLHDGGAAHFAEVVKCLRETIPGATIELLIPDFQGSASSLETVVSSGPDVLNHNLETISRLYPTVRPQADYRRSLELLGRAACVGDPPITKSGLMVGLGETEEEITQVMRDLRSVHCSTLTIGQYLRPSRAQISVAQYIEPSQFERYVAIGKSLGFREVFAGPFVRSSYRAEELLKR